MNPKAFFFLTLLPVLMITGCAAHYVRRDEGRTNLYLRYPDAKEVALATSLDGFRPHPANRTDNGKWVVAVEGSQDFSYFYLVDGKVLIPDCRMVEKDDFGGINCVYSHHL